MKKSIKKSIKKSVKKLTRKHLLDIDYIKKITPRLHELKTTLKKIENKRVGLFANRAYFSNEPSMGQKENCTLKFKNILEETMNKKLTAGDFVVYPLIATSDIKKGDEIVWLWK